MKKQLSPQQKQLDADLWIIALVSLGAFLCYGVMEEPLLALIRRGDVFILVRLLVMAAVQFGVAGLGITMVQLLRREPYSQFGLHRKHAAAAVGRTVLCFLPYLVCLLASGQLEGYRPFSILLTEELLASGLPISVLGTAVVAVVWGFFEGFNYGAVADKINARYPTESRWLDTGALVCALVCLLVHPLNFSLWGAVESITAFFAIYTMLLVKKSTGNGWGCVFAFCFIWNAF